VRLLFTFNFSVVLLGIVLIGAPEVNVVQAETTEFKATINKQMEVAGIAYMTVTDDENNLYVVFPEEDFYELMDYVHTIEAFTQRAVIGLDRCEREKEILHRRASRCDKIQFAEMFNTPKLPEESK